MTLAFIIITIFECNEVLKNIYRKLIFSWQNTALQDHTCPHDTVFTLLTLTLSNPIFLPTAYSPALICFGRQRSWWITCNYPTVLKEKNMEKQKEYNLRSLLAKVRTTWGKASDRLRQRANKCNKNRVGRLPTLEQKWKIVLLDEVQCRIGKG
jgi:hypothetical protein